MIAMCLLLHVLAGGATALTQRDAMTILNVRPGFSEQELKKAYREQSLIAHPDKGGSSDQFVRVAAAFELLSGNKSSRSPKEVSQEEMFRHAEAMFDQVFDEFHEMDGDKLAKMMIDQIFDQNKKSWGQWIGKKLVFFFVPRIHRLFMSALESENADITINGHAMSGAEFKTWREGRTKSKAKAKAESVGGIPEE